MQTAKLLLDTHVLIWLMNGDQRLPKKLQKIIESAHQHNHLFISAITLWEVGMLEQKGRITLNTPCIEWIKKALSFGIQLVPLTPEITVESCHLPNYDFGDPADRMIIATARVEALTIVTLDGRVLAYAGEKLVSAVGP